MAEPFSLPVDNRDPSVRQWLHQALASGEGASSMLVEARERKAIVDRLMADLDDRSRLVLEALDRRYDEGELTRLQQGLHRVLSGEPVQRVVGWTEFRGLRMGCSGEVLIPRPETEEVVGWFLRAMDGLPGDPARRRVLDVGTGSGCMALAMQAERPGWEVVAMDLSATALEQAAQNASCLGLQQVKWVLADALDLNAWPSGQFDGIVSNPPYIPHSEHLASHVHDHEPGMALYVPDEDPLCFYAALAKAATHKLTAPGCVVAETHSKFTPDVVKCWQLEGGQVDVLIDLQGAERAVSLRRN